MKKGIGIIAFSLLMVSCAGISSFQDGRTLGKQNLEITPSVSASKFKNHTIQEGENEEYDFAPLLTLRARYGVKENFDLGLYIDQSLNIGLSTKYQFIGKGKEAKFNSSIGLDLGANPYAFAYNSPMFYYSVPLYFSFNPDEKKAFYFIPRFINNTKYVLGSKYNNQKKGVRYSINRVALSYGFLFGKKNKYGIEVQHSSINAKIYVPTHIALGYIIRF